MEQQPQQTRRRQCAVVLFFASALVATTSDMTAEAWRPSSRVASFGPRHHQQQRRCRHACTLSQLYSSEEDIADEDRTSFDDAGRALKEEEDQEAMESMGDFDENPSFDTDNIEKMREAIKSRTENLGIEKSKVSADYFAAKAQEARNAGPGGGSANEDTFGGIDLSQISTSKLDAVASGAAKSSQWDESMPSMMYDPADEMSQEEQEEADPTMKLSLLDQGMEEFKAAKWPTFGAAMKEVALVLAIIAITGFLVVAADKGLRVLYTNLGFIPSAEDLQNYGSRFDGLDLPKGWTDNMNVEDMEKLADAGNNAVSAAVKAAAKAGGTSGLPDL